MANDLLSRRPRATAASPIVNNSSQESKQNTGRFRQVSAGEQSGQGGDRMVSIELKYPNNAPSARWKPEILELASRERKRPECVTFSGRLRSRLAIALRKGTGSC